MHATDWVALYFCVVYSNSKNFLRNCFTFFTDIKSSRPIFKFNILLSKSIIDEVITGHILSIIF